MKGSLPRLHKIFILWFTGLPCSGKTTLALALKKKIKSDYDISLAILDGDILRQNLSKDLGYSTEDRRAHNLRTASHANQIVQSGTPVCVSLISPCRNTREEIKKTFSNVFEVYIKCSLTECERRDNKGLYKKARMGNIKNFTGVDGLYDPPTHPDILVETEKYGAEKSISHILERLKDLKIIKG